MKGVGLVALLSVSCVSTDNDQVYYGKNDFLPRNAPISVPVSGKGGSSYGSGVAGSNLPGNNYSGQNPSDYGKFDGNSANLGLFTVSSSDNRDSLRFGLSPFPAFALEIPIRKLDVYGEPLYDGRLNEDPNIWMVGNGYLNNGDRPPVPLSLLGKVVKKVLWDTNVVAPVRKVAEQFSDLSNGPTQLIFGKGSSSTLELKLDSDRVGLGYEIKLPSLWSLKFEYQHAIGDNEENALMFLMSTPFVTKKR